MNNEIEVLYFKIAEKAIEIIPTEWNKIILNAEIEPGVVSSYFCFYTKKDNELIEFNKISKIFNVDRQIYLQLFSELTDLIYKLNEECAKYTKPAWTIMTFILSSDGAFNIDYSYDDLSTSSTLSRRYAFKETYLNN